MTPEFDGRQIAELLYARSVTACPYEECARGLLCIRCLGEALTRAFHIGRTVQLTFGTAGQVLQEAIMSSYAAGVEAHRARMAQILGPVPDLCPRCQRCPCGAPQGMQAEIAAALQESAL